MANTQLFQWQTHRNVWSEALADPALNRFAQPALLAFSLRALLPDLNHMPTGDLVAQPEAGPSPLGRGWAGWDSWQSQVQGLPFKLYQPTQGRLYGVAASLVRPVPGLPPTSPEPNHVGFVVRRLRLQGAPAESGWVYAEAAWVPTPPEKLFSMPQPGEWLPVTPSTVLDGEEVLRMFPLSPGSKGPPADFWGMVPTYRREQYDKVSCPVTAGESALVDEFNAQVVAPLESLLAIDDALAPLVSTMLLLKLGTYLQRYAPGGIPSLPVRAYWSQALQTVWHERSALIEGVSGTQLYNLKGAVRPADIAQLSEFMSSLVPPTTTVSMDQKGGGFYVIRCVFNQGDIALLSEASWPFQMAKYNDPGSPQPDPPTDPT